MSGMNRHCIPGLTMSNSPDGELLLRECPGIIKTMHTGLSALPLRAMPTPGVINGRNRRDLAWKDLCSVLNALSK